MKLYIKQNVFTLGEKFYVKDEFGTDIYYVEGSFMRIPKQFKIYNAKNDLVVSIESQLFRLFSHYDITTFKETLTVRQEFSFFRPVISILNSKWRLQGDFWGHDYQVMNADKPIMRLRKHWFTWGDSYELNIGNPEDAALCVAISIIVDNILLKAQNSN